jgi:L-lactate permease
MYTGTPISSPLIQKCVHYQKNITSWKVNSFWTIMQFEVLLFCVWCLDNWSQILSGKPFNTISMARVKTLQYYWVVIND